MRKITLNNDKRKILADEIENHYKSKASKERKAHIKSIKDFDKNIDKVFSLIVKSIKKHQPPKDVETVKSMIDKYGDGGGQIHNDNCFYFETPTTDEEGNERTKEINIAFELSDSFKRSYYHDFINKNGYDPHYYHKYRSQSYDRRRNKDYDFHRTNIDNLIDRSNGDKPALTDTLMSKYSFDVIGSSYCGSRKYKVDSETFEVFNKFKIIMEQVEQTHEKLFDYVEEKMKTVRKALASFKTLEQAQEAFSKTGVKLNKEMLGASAEPSMALSVYTPDALANLLNDEEPENDNANRIALFKAGKLNQAIN